MSVNSHSDLTLAKCKVFWFDYNDTFSPDPRYPPLYPRFRYEFNNTESQSSNCCWTHNERYKYDFFIVNLKLIFFFKVVSQIALLYIQTTVMTFFVLRDLYHIPSGLFHCKHYNLQVGNDTLFFGGLVYICIYNLKLPIFFIYFLSYCPYVVWMDRVHYIIKIVTKIWFPVRHLYIYSILVLLPYSYKREIEGNMFVQCVKQSSYNLR